MDIGIVLVKRLAVELLVPATVPRAALVAQGIQWTYQRHMRSSLHVATAC